MIFFHFCSFGTYSSASLFYQTLSGKSVLFPALENSGLMKRSCCTLSCRVRYFTENKNFRVSPMCAVALFARCRLCLVFVVLGQSGATLRLSSISKGVCQRLSSTELQGSLPVLSFRKFFLVGEAFNPTSCLPPAHCWSFSLNDVSFPLPWAGVSLEWCWPWSGHFLYC